MKREENLNLSTFKDLNVLEFDYAVRCDNLPANRAREKKRYRDIFSRTETPKREFPGETSFVPLSLSLSRRISSVNIHVHCFDRVLKKLTSFSGLPATGNVTIVRVHVAQGRSSLPKLSSSIVVAARSTITLFRDYRLLAIHLPPSKKKEKKILHPSFTTISQRQLLNEMNKRDKIRDRVTPVRGKW